MDKFWAYLKTKSFRNTLLLAIGSVITIVLIAFFSLGFYTSHGSGIPVPNLIGMPVERAISLLNDQGFRYEVDTVYRDAAPGTVIEQDPDPETNVKENRVIYLTMVTLQAPPVSLPDIEQKPFAEAQAILTNNGLKIGDTTYSADIARNVVLEIKLAGQSIKAGTKIPKGSKLDLVLGDGKGASEVPVPDLINLEVSEARFTISHSGGLTLGTITYLGPITADSSNLIIVAQSPMKTDSASKVSIGTKINITVKQGKKTNTPF